MVRDEGEEKHREREGEEDNGGKIIEENYGARRRVRHMRETEEKRPRERYCGD